jgi:bifunctional non-homologous end joining protein LigD
VDERPVSPAPSLSALLKWKCGAEQERTREDDGVTGEAYWEKDAPGFTPEWVETFPVPRRSGGPHINYILIQNTATLVWAANAAALELHPFLHRVPDIEQPTSIVFDLDPGEGAALGPGI